MHFLNCGFLNKNDAEQFTCAYLLPYIFFGGTSIQILCPFLIRLFAFFSGCVVIYSYILNTMLLSVILFPNIFSICGLFLTFLIESFDSQNFKILMKSNFSVFSFVTHSFAFICKKTLLDLRS